MERNKVLVTCKVFTEKMNEALHRNPGHDGMNFPYSEDGLVLFAPMLRDTARMALQKSICDEVSEQYTITRS